LKVDPIPVTWHSIRGIPSEYHPEIISALLKDVDLDSCTMSTTNCYSYGKQVARGARLALILEEVNYVYLILAIRRFLKDGVVSLVLTKLDPDGV